LRRRPIRGNSWLDSGMPDNWANDFADHIERTCGRKGQG
jgi:hypothetical protein